MYAFWMWQSVEVMYHIAVWQYLAQFTGAHFGLPQGGYAALSLLRIAGTLFLVVVLIRRARQAGNTQGSAFDLLFEASKAYP